MVYIGVFDCPSFVICSVCFVDLIGDVCVVTSLLGPPNFHALCGFVLVLVFFAYWVCLRESFLYSILLPVPFYWVVFVSVGNGSGIFVSRPTLCLYRSINGPGFLVVVVCRNALLCLFLGCVARGISVKGLGLYTFLRLHVSFVAPCFLSSFVFPMFFALRSGICGRSGCSIFAFFVPHLALYRYLVFFFYCML